MVINIAVKRLKTYIKGLDDVIEGGFPQYHNILLCGKAGTFKSTFAYQFCYHGALNDEPSMYITLEESIESLENAMRNFGMSKELENFVKLDMSCLRKIANQKWSLENPSYRVDWFPTIKQSIETMSEELGIKRLAFDSLNALYELVAVESKRIRKDLFDFLTFLKDKGLTTLLISELPLTYDSYGKFGIEDFLSDGIILIETIVNGMEVEKYLRVVKLRATNHETSYLPLQVDESGLSVFAPKKL